MVARTAVSDDHHVMRYISASKRFLDADAVRRGPAAAGFVLRDEDRGGLSVTEIELFGACDAKSRRAAAIAHRETLSSKKLGAQAIFAWAKVGDIKSSGVTYRKTLRVVHDPVPGNDAHAEVRHFSDDDLDLLAYFATDVFRDYEVVADMGIPPIAT